MSFFCYQITTVLPTQNRCAGRLSKRDIHYTNNIYCQENSCFLLFLCLCGLPVLAGFNVKYLTYSGSRDQIQVLLPLFSRPPSVSVSHKISLNYFSLQFPSLVLALWLETAWCANVQMTFPTLGPFSHWVVTVWESSQQQITKMSAAAFW